MSPSPSVSTADREKLLSQLEAMQGQVMVPGREEDTVCMHTHIQSVGRGEGVHINKWEKDRDRWKTDGESIGR